jgi:hypothetical protein
VDTDYLGFQSSLSALDYDGDGTLDLAVGGTYVNSNGTGGVYVLSSADAATWSGTADSNAEADIDGAGSYGYFGTMAQRQGDHDGDGLQDLLVAGTDYSGWSGGSSVPAVAVFLNGDISDGDSGDASIRFDGSLSTYFNAKVQGALDFDGDGFDDLFYGDHYGASSSYRRGYVPFFSVGGLSGSSYDLYDDYDFYLQGDNSGDGLGWSIGGDDVDGDGYDDVLLGAPFDDNGASNGGCVFLVSGQAGLSGNASVGFGSQASICGDTANALLGWNAEPQLADFDGDGTLDLALSAPGADKAYVWFNAASLSGSVSTSAASVTISHAGTADLFGFALATGDVDGDGKADLFVSAPDGNAFDPDSSNYDVPADEAGVVYLFGGADMPTTGAAAVDTTAARGAITGAGNDLFGLSLLSADWSGDGKSDLVVTAPNWTSDYGRAYLFVVP